MQELMPESETRVARFHDIESLMERLKLGRSKVFAFLGRGELRSVKVGRRRLVSEAALADFIEWLEAADDLRASPPKPAPQQPVSGGSTAPSNSRKTVVADRIAELGGGGDHAA